MKDTVKPENEDKWQEESWARTLIEAEAIKADKDKYKKALVAAKKMVKEKQDEAKAAEKVASPKQVVGLDDE